MTITTHIDAIRRDILESPDADDLRLVLADMLRDSHRPRDVAEGEFVAASMALATCELSRCLADPPEGMGNCLRCEWCARWCAVVMTKRFWWGEGPLDHCRSPRQAMHGRNVGLFPMAVFGFWRGLPEVWAVADVPTFEVQAKDVFSRHPIRRVVLRCEVRTLVWESILPTHPSDCGPALWDLLDGRDRGWYKLYETDSGDDSPALARADLEAACVHYGRMVAKLPALEAPR